MIHVPALAATAILAVVLRTVAMTYVRYARSVFGSKDAQALWFSQAAIFLTAAFDGPVSINVNRVEAAGGC